MNKTKWLFSCLMVGSLLQATCAFSSQANLKSVVTEGMGKDSHSAIQDAVKNALINVAGTFIDVDISIEQHKKIQDGLAEQTKNIRKEITEYIDTFRWEYRPEEKKRQAGSSTKCASFFVMELLGDN